MLLLGQPGVSEALSSLQLQTDFIIFTTIFFYQYLTFKYFGVVKRRFLMVKLLPLPLREFLLNL
jgi:hypothetical protein